MLHKPGRTECLVVLKGGHQKREVFWDKHRTINVSGKTFKPLAIRVVAAYKHLGGYITATSSMHK